MSIMKAMLRKREMNEYANEKGQDIRGECDVREVPLEKFKANLSSSHAIVPSL